MKNGAIARGLWLDRNLPLVTGGAPRRTDQVQYWFYMMNVNYCEGHVKIFNKLESKMCLINSFAPYWYVEYINMSV